MTVDQFAASGPRRVSWLCRQARLGLVVALSLLLATGHRAEADIQRRVIVRDDRGGSVIERAHQIREYAARNTRVEIRGSVCLSACTMYLALAETCVEPQTTFGFHGPSSRLYGVALKPERFEKWSVEMASYYPEPLRSWYLKTARHKIVGFFELSGAELIRMGFRDCG